MHIKISISKQQLILFGEEDSIKQYSISTAKNGSGERKNSECTPRGEHIIAEKIGHDAKQNSVFVGRVETNELYDLKMRDLYPDRDWILTRILWLSGMEEGKNKGDDVYHDGDAAAERALDYIEMGFTAIKQDPTGPYSFQGGRELSLHELAR